MEKNNQVNLLKNPAIIKDDLFTEYLNCNNFENEILNEEFINPNNETFDKFFNNDENSYKSLNSINDFSNANNRKSSVPDSQINELFKFNNSNLYNFKFGNGGYEKNMNEENIQKPKEEKLIVTIDSKVFVSKGSSDPNQNYLRKKIFLELCPKIKIAMKT